MSTPIASTGARPSQLVYFDVEQERRRRLQTERDEPESTKKARESLYEFTKQGWTALESQPMMDNWHIEAICLHIQAVLDDWIAVQNWATAKKLFDDKTPGAEHPGPEPVQRMRNVLFNVPPGTAKPCYTGCMVNERTKGRIPLSDVVVGDFVLTHKGRFRKVLAVHEQGILPLLEIRTGHGRKMKVALDHPVLTARGWVEAKDITTNDTLAEIHALEPSGTSTMPMEEARLLGYLIGDGSVKGGETACTNQDPEVIEDVIHCAETLGFDTVVRWATPPRKASIISIKSRKREVMCGACNAPTPGANFLCKPCAKARASERQKVRYAEKKEGGKFKPMPREDSLHGKTYRSEVRDWRRKHEIDGKCSYDKRVPQAILAGNSEIIADFLAAYWACDGTIDYRPDATRANGNKQAVMRITCCTVSEGLARDIQHLFTRLGISTHVRTKTTQLKSRVQGDLYTAWYVSMEDQDNASKFMSIVGHRMRHEKRHRITNLIRSKFDAVLNPDKVAAVESAGEGECRCLTVEEDESFTLEDLAVHNSRIVSVMAPAWMWLKYPSWRGIFLSANPKVALRDATYCRDLMRSDWYQDTFNPSWTLRADQSAKGSYWNTEGGARTSLGMLAQIVGSRGDALFIDDPHDPEQAHSDTIRENIVERWKNSIENRLNDLRVSVRIGIMQRVHEGDWSHHVKERGWNYIVLPMEFEPRRYEPENRDYIPPVSPIGWRDPRKKEGELLFPQRFTPAVLAEEKAKGELYWAGQYQQRPTPAGGNMFREEMFLREVDGKFEYWPFPDLNEYEALEGYFSFDTAFKIKISNDFTAGCLTFMCADGYVYLLPLMLARKTAPQVQKMMAVSWARWKKVLGFALKSVKLETQTAGASIAQEMPILMAQRRGQEQKPSPIWKQEEWDLVRNSPPIVVHEYNTTRAKEYKAYQVLPYCEGRNVRLIDTVISRQWLEMLLAFPMGTNDDAVDATVAGIEPFIETADGSQIVSEGQLERVLKK